MLIDNNSRHPETNNNSNRDGTSPQRQSSIGVVIVNWNTFDDLNRCLNHLALQDIVITKTIIIDNASTTPPPPLTDLCPPNTCVISLPENVGFAKANNIAVAELDDCDWVALVNPDAFLEPDCLRSLLAASQRHPLTACFGAVTIQANHPDRLDGIGDHYHLSGLMWRGGYDLPITQIPDNEIEIFSACAATAIYRRDVYLSLGGLDEDYFCYSEDVDLGFRIRLLGYKVRVVPSARSLHVGSVSSGGQHSDFALYHGHRNLVWTFIKCMPLSLLIPLLPIHIVMNIFSVIYFAFVGRGRLLMRAKIDAIQGIPKMLLKRKEIQNKRRASIATIWRALNHNTLSIIVNRLKRHHTS